MLTYLTLPRRYIYRHGSMLPGATVLPGLHAGHVALKLIP